MDYVIGRIEQLTTADAHVNETPQPRVAETSSDFWFVIGRRIIKGDDNFCNYSGRLQSNLKAVVHQMLVCKAGGACFFTVKAADIFCGFDQLDNYDGRMRANLAAVLASFGNC